MGALEGYLNEVENWLIANGAKIETIDGEGRKGDFGSEVRARRQNTHI